LAVILKVTSGGLTGTIWSTGWTVMFGTAQAVEQTITGIRRVMAKNSRVFAFIVYLHTKKFILNRQL
jgi:hypothetical protein